jgi:hypothetical protein
MRSMPRLREVESREAFFAHEDEAVGRSSERITATDERLARVREEASKLEHGARHRPSEPQIRVNTLRPAVRRNRTMLRGLIGLLLAMCICGAAIASRSHDGQVAKLIIAQWIPQRPASNSSPVVSAQSRASVVQLAAAEAISPLPQGVPRDNEPRAGLASPELTQLLETVVRDVTNAKLEIAQLKANQQQMARDSANAVEQLKASQDQMARVIAMTSERKLRPRTSAPRGPPSVTQTHQPMPQSPQAKAQP